MKLQTIRKKSLLFILITFFIISLTGYQLINDREYKISKGIDIFFSVFREVSTLYVDEIDPEKLINASINGMLSILDPYTTFIPESEADELNFMTTGEYGGIGAIIKKAGEYVIILEIYKNTPSHKAGLLPGDTIISIDKKSTKSLSINEISDLLKGIPGTTVNLEIKRMFEKKIIKKEITREKITISNVSYSGILSNKYGYIKLSNFTKDASKEMHDKLIELKNNNIEGLIIDLRDNPGGLLIEAVKIANLFLSKNNEIVSIKGRIQQWNKTYYTEEEPLDTLLPIVILVNKNTASASEILAGSLQDYDRAVIVGEKTFGKGLVQTTRQLGYNTQLKITTSRYYIPSGRCIQKIDYSGNKEIEKKAFKTKNGRTVYDAGGITPDISYSLENYHDVVLALINNDFIFNFATYYLLLNKNQKIIFTEVNDSIFNIFLNYCISNKFDYNTQTYNKLNELIFASIKDDIYQNIEQEINSIKTKLHHDIKSDIINNKEIIKNLIEEEFFQRHYFQEGRIQKRLQRDSLVHKAILLLENKKLYYSILNINTN